MADFEDLLEVAVGFGNRSLGGRCRRRASDLLVSRLRQGGIPVFRTVDRAMEILELYGRWAAGDATLATMRDDQG